MGYSDNLIYLYMYWRTQRITNKFHFFRNKNAALTINPPYEQSDLGSLSKLIGIRFEFGLGGPSKQAYRILSLTLTGILA